MMDLDAITGLLVGELLGFFSGALIMFAIDMAWYKKVRQAWRDALDSWQEAYADLQKRFIEEIKRKER